MIRDVTLWGWLLNVLRRYLGQMRRVILLNIKANVLMRHRFYIVL